MRKVTVFSIVLVLLVSMTLLVSCQTTGNEELKSEISVQGSSVITVDPDIVNFTVRVSETAPTTGEAQQETNTKISAILAILDSYGIEKKYIQTNSLSFSTDYNWEDGQQIFVDERVTQQVSVVMHDLSRFTALVDELGTKLTGINFNSVNFDKEDKTECYKEARTKAILDAREKAEAYALASGLVLGKPMTINEGYAYVSTNNMVYAAAPKAMAAGVSEDAMVATEAPTGQLEVSASVNVVFRAE